MFQSLLKKFYPEQNPQFPGNLRAGSGCFTAKGGLIIVPYLITVYGLGCDIY